MAGAFVVAPYVQLLDADGIPLAGGLLYAYAAGSGTWQKLYTDNLLAVEHPQPIQLDTAGRFVAYAQNLSYKLVVKKSDGSTWWTQDNYWLPPPSGGGTTAADVPDWMTALIF